MDEEENRKKLAAGYTIGQELMSFSIDELRELKVLLENEMVRISNMETEKTSHMSAAEALFKT